MEQICFELENIEVSFLDKTILKLDRLAVHQFDRIGIVGKNGAGKSTLLSNIATRGPGLTISPKVRIGYFWQMSYRFTSDETVLELLKNHSEYEDEGFLRSILHSM